jgi:hypothetical protein
MRRYGERLTPVLFVAAVALLLLDKWWTAPPDVTPLATVARPADTAAVDEPVPAEPPRREEPDRPRGERWAILPEKIREQGRADLEIDRPRRFPERPV